jgi:hypothetical protein
MEDAEIGFPASGDRGRPRRYMSANIVACVAGRIADRWKWREPTRQAPDQHWKINSFGEFGFIGKFSHDLLLLILALLRVNHSVYVGHSPRDVLPILSFSVVLISHFHPSLTGWTISVRYQS